MPLTVCPDPSVAAWIVDDPQPWQTTVRYGPRGLPASARLLFVPDPGPRDRAGRDTGAARSPRSSSPPPSESDLLLRALDVLAEFTSTAERCYVCLWDGWGLAPGGGPLRTGPRVRLPHRAYVLLQGALPDVRAWMTGDPSAQPPREPMPPPAFVWPADRAWCVADDVDPTWAGIGASPAAVARLRAEPGLDVVLADPREDALDR